MEVPKWSCGNSYLPRVMTYQLYKPPGSLPIFLSNLTSYSVSIRLTLLQPKTRLVFVSDNVLSSHSFGAFFREAWSCTKPRTGSHRASLKICEDVRSCRKLHRRRRSAPPGTMTPNVVWQVIPRRIKYTLAGTDTHGMAGYPDSTNTTRLLSKTTYYTTFILNE